jgi:uncharacterized membrane protein
MKKAKAYAVFFTLVFFGSLANTMYLIFGGSNPVLLSVSILFNLVLLFFAVRYWRRTFRNDN